MKSGPPSKRLERVAELLTREIATLLSREVKDPRVDGVTITAIRVTPDLRQARVFFSAPEAQKEAAEKGLNSAAGFLHRALVDRLEMRIVPRLQFQYDESLAEGARMEELFNRIHREA